MPPKYKWTGIGLLIGGGVTMLTGAVADETCYEQVGYDPDFCEAYQAGWIGAGVAMAGVGTVLLAIGNAKREPAPSSTVAIGWNRLTWRIRF